MAAAGGQDRQHGGASLCCRVLSWELACNGFCRKIVVLGAPVSALQIARFWICSFVRISCVNLFWFLLDFLLIWLLQVWRNTN